MKTSETIIKTRDGSAYIRKLAKHFAHKIQTSYTETEGKAEFPYGKALMFASEEELRIEITSESFEGIARIKYVIVTHLEKFAFREELAIKWLDDPLAPEPDWNELGRQLGNPSGDLGRKTGISMNHANMGMIMRSFELLEPASRQQFLELGPGNGAHLKEVTEKWPGLYYTGVEISETMIQDASEKCQGMRDVSFILTDGHSLPFANESFDKIVTVNTVYFWENPKAYAEEIRRVLKRGQGVFCLSFVQSWFMEKLPFTKEGFDLYDTVKAQKLLTEAGFRILQTVSETEIIRSNTGEKVERERVFVLAASII